MARVLKILDLSAYGYYASKKSHKHSGKLTSVLYELVHEENEKGEHFSVARVLKILDLSAYGYYAWLHRTPSPQEQPKQEVKKQIKLT